MLHAKFQDHKTFGTKDEDFKSVFTISGFCGQLGHVTKTIFIK